VKYNNLREPLEGRVARVACFGESHPAEPVAADFENAEGALRTVGGPEGCDTGVLTRMSVRRYAEAFADAGSLLLHGTPVPMASTASLAAWRGNSLQEKAPNLAEG
jgi:hypothetical protein